MSEIVDEFYAALDEQRHCRFCGHDFVLKNAIMRSVPQAPKNGMTIYMLVPSCPKCDRPNLSAVPAEAREFPFV